MAILNAGIMFILFEFGCGSFYEGGPNVRRTSMKWSTVDENLRNTVVMCPDW
jgi:hypothetical protein